MKANKTRFSPSPTGLLHLGNLRTALFSFLMAQKHKSPFLLRIEDTDFERSKEEFSKAICEDLNWMQLNWDEGPHSGGKEDSYYQSERVHLYEEFYSELLDKNLIYPCFTSEEELKIIRRNQIAAGEPPRYTGVWSEASENEIQEELDKGNQPVYRFRIPKDQNIKFVDLVKGEQSFSTNDLDDFIVRKKDATPTFMFANAVDDSLMEVDLVLRGDDHLSTQNISSSPSKFDMDQLLFWQKKTVESLTVNECKEWLEKHLRDLPSDLNHEDFIELVKDNINFPEEAKNYLNKLFYQPLTAQTEVENIIKTAGKEFYLVAYKVIDSGFDNWIEATKLIGGESGKKGKDLFMPLRVAITGQTKGPELDKVVDFIGVNRVLERVREASEL